MSFVEFTPLKDFQWIRGKPARIWFLQPKLHILGGPLVSTKRGQDATGLDLLAAVLLEEGKYDPPVESPCFVLMPEFAIPPKDIQAARTLIAATRPNTVVIFGVGQMSEAEALAIDSADLWDGPCYDKWTNCAAVGIGGSDNLFLQPKIVPSKWEHDSHWRGKKVRYFEGKCANFIVVVCSELLAQPHGQTTLANVVKDLHEKNRVLELVIWLQYNQHPRSNSFNQSFAAIQSLKPEIFVVSSRNDRPKRVDNFGVSGAIVPHSALPSGFDVLDANFRYVEPLSMTANLPMSRLVLLRYDADVYLARTVLSGHLGMLDGVAKGALFQQCHPFQWVADKLQSSPSNIHLFDLVAPARQTAKDGYPNLKAEIDNISDLIVQGGTPQFLGLLDVATLPKRPYEHAAGQKHRNGDYLCRCWPHRECIDSIGHEKDSIESLAVVIETAAAILKEGVHTRPEFNRDGRTNFSISIRGQQAALGIVDAADTNAIGVEKALSANRASINGSPYVVRGTIGPARPPVGSVNAAQPNPLGALNPSTSSGPSLKAIYESDYREALDRGTLEALLYERLVA